MEAKVHDSCFLHNRCYFAAALQSWSIHCSLLYQLLYFIFVVFFSLDKAEQVRWGKVNFEHHSDSGE